MTTGKTTALGKILLPAFVAVLALLAAAWAGQTEKAEAVPTQLTVGLDMKTLQANASTYDINNLPAFEQCVDVKTSVNSGIFYVDVFVLNATNHIAFNADMEYTIGKMQVMQSDVKKFYGTSSTITNLSGPSYNATADAFQPANTSGVFFSGAVDTGAGHTGSGVLARIKGQALNVGPNNITFKFSTATSKGVTLTADPGATHPGDTNGDGRFDGPFINAIGTIAVDQPDTDLDTVSNTCDNCPTTSNTNQLNTDGDSQGDVCDTDDDNDGVLDGADNCPLVPNPTQDPSACADTDLDGVLDGLDNCPTVSNANQANFDLDSQGDACDADDDNDGVPDSTDNCDFASNPTQANWNGNATGDACEDADGDGWLDSADNCKSLANPGQENADGDNYGTTCDNCPAKANNTQADVDTDLIGDACDDSDTDGWTDDVEVFTGTLWNQKCAATTGSNNENPDSVPADTNDNRVINTIDIAAFIPVLNSNVNNGPPYTVRLDFTMNGAINTLDVAKFIPVLNTTCTP